MITIIFYENVFEIYPVYMEKFFVYHRINKFDKKYYHHHVNNKNKKRYVLLLKRFVLFLTAQRMSEVNPQML